MANILNKLKLGDRRTTGKSNEVAKIIDDPELFAEVFQGLYSENPGLRMRCADSLEKAAAERHGLIQPYKQKLLEEISKIDQQEVKWHVAQLISYLDLNDQEKFEAASVLFKYIATAKSNIVKVFSMQALADLSLSMKDEGFRKKVLETIEELVGNGAPSVRARGKKLLELLKNKAV